MRVSFTFLAVCGSLLAILQECSGRDGTEACNTTDTSGIYGRDCTGSPDVCVEPVFTCKPLETESSTQRCQCENDDSPECEKYLFDRTLQHGARDLTVEIEIKSSWICLKLLCWKPSTSLDWEKCNNTSSVNLTELDPGTPHDFVVHFDNKLTEKMFNRTWKEYTLPAKPQNVTPEDDGDGTLEIRWVQQGRVDNTQCDLVASADGSVPLSHREERAFCKWSSLEPFLHFNKVQITVESGGQKANITFDLDYAFVPEVVQSVDVTDVSATSVNVTVVERTAGIGNVSVDRVDVYYAVNRSDGECVVFQRRKTTLCQRPTELAACGDGKVIIDPPVTSPHSSTTTSIPPTSAATTASPQTSTTTKALPVSGGDTKHSKVRPSAMAEPGAKSKLLLEVGDLETATRYTLELTPWFVDCGASDSRAFRGKTKSLGEVTTLFQVTNVTAGPVGSQLRVEWETSRAPSDVSYTVYVTDTVHVKPINKNCSVSSRKRVLGDCSTNTKCESGWCSCLGVTPAAFWEYSLAVGAKTTLQMTTYSSPVEVISPPTAPGTVSSLKVTMWKDGQTACPGLVNASVVCVTWQDMCPRKRNSFILAYEYTLRGKQGCFEECNRTDTMASYFAKDATSTSPNASHKYRRDSTQKQYQVLLHVDPGVTYELSVRAVNKMGTRGEAATKTFTALTVPEVPDRESMKELVPETEVIAGLHTLQFTVKSTKFLFEEDVKGRGVIVTAGNRQPLSLEALKDNDTYYSWCDREKALESGGYRVNETTLEEETNSPVRVKIGDNSDCLKQCIRYCDGPLHSDTSYSVWVYLCNEAYCTSVALIQNQKTQAAAGHKHDTGDDGAVLGAILIVSGLLLIVCSLVLVIYCVMCRNRSGSGRITSENELSEWNDGLHMVNNRRTRPLTLASLENEIKRKQRDDSLLLREEFDDLSWMTPKYPHHAGCLDINLCKNRYVNIMAYDHSRVKLSLDHEGSDFINANYVPGYTRDDEYIAAQGPLPFTISDFWRMIWEHRIPIIVMLTLPKENGKIKCEQYWQPQRGDVVKYDNIIVKTASVSNINDYNITIFSLENTQEEGEEREVVHFHYLKWLDMTADLSPVSLVEFLTVVRQHIRPDRPEPTLVHCSAGVGRTGTFICIDYVMHFINEHHIEDELDIFAFILHMRDFRCNMVQTEDQYIFIHQCARYLMAARRRKETEMLDNGASRAHASTGSCLFDMANNDGSGEIRSINDDLMALALEPADMDTVELDTSETTAPDEECRSRQLKDVAANGDAPLATSSTENICVP